ncbi:50S ribosomal protein L32 [Desulfovibrionales bacterium]
MALPKKRTSKSRKGMRRSHDHLAVPTVIFCKCGEPSLSHRVCPSCGTYKGRQYLKREELNCSHRTE